MPRKVCVEPPSVAVLFFPAFPLQVAFERHPEWRGHPAAIVESDSPRAFLLYVNEEARRLGVRTGMRYAAALSLCAELRGTVLSLPELSQASSRIVALLQPFTPVIEASPPDSQPGLFSMRTHGLQLVFSKVKPWAEDLLAAISEAGYHGRLVAGHHAFAATVIAREQAKPLTIFATPQHEQARLSQCRLESLHLRPHVRDELERLGITSVGQFLELPEASLSKRYGAELGELRRLAAGGDALPFVPASEAPPVTLSFPIEPPTVNTTQLLFIIKRLLPKLLQQLRRGYEMLETLSIRLQYTPSRPPLEDTLLSVRVAAPTDQEATILELVRLRFERLELAGEVSDLVVSAKGAEPKTEQDDLLKEKPRRNIEAGRRAIARIQAEFGKESVFRLVPTNSHLPEHRFRCEPMTPEMLSLPEAPSELDPVVAFQQEQPLSLVRRLLPKPTPLFPWLRQQKTRLTEALPCAADALQAAPETVTLSGGWWGRGDRRATTRHYRSVETEYGHLLWVYYDPNRRIWMLQGMVE